MTLSFEVNFDGLVGPTHNYAGLSVGNVASESHASQESKPREAALQGIAKMEALLALGLKQAVLPPQLRPAVETLRRLGFTGTDSAVIAAAAKKEPRLLAACSSASAMWTANAATVAPSSDTADKRVHLTPANLVAKFHRSLEPQTTARTLRAIFRDEKHFVVHDPLPPSELLGDEGAANHTRFAASHGGPGVHLFVYGRAADSTALPKIYPARQTRDASEAVARLHRLDDAATCFVQQSPEAIDAGVFHNDVIAVGNESVLFHHERAFVDGARAVRELAEKFRKRTGRDLTVCEVAEKEVSLADAVRSYLFNSQLVTLPNGRRLLVAPSECERTPAVKRYLEGALGTAFDEVRYFDLRQSMNNGGGPACLRLRVVLTETEIARCAPGVFLTPTLAERLRHWVRRHYRETLSPKDLADPQLHAECLAALTELSEILSLPALG